MDVGTELERIAADKTSGASAIFEAALTLLETLGGRPDEVVRVARRLVRAQPTMAPVWRAAVEVVAAIEEPERFTRFAMRARRAPAALTRLAVEALRGEASSTIRFVTLSRSGAVARAIIALAGTAAVRVACSESRPALEGRRLAAELAAAGIEVTCYGDAAIAEALEPGAVVVLGADAIGPDRFFNKAGSRMLAAAAAQRGVPCFVLATRDKFVAGAIEDQLRIRDEPAEEIWPQPPAGVMVRNPYFEAIPHDLVSAVITDAGLIGAADVPDVCAATLDPAARRALQRLR